MFPYPSGVGLHVGHPLGFIATDVYARFSRMTGFNVLHAMGYDAFGLPGRAVRGADRHAPARHHRGEHRQHEAPDARARPRSRPAPRARPPPTSTTTAGRSGSSCRSTTPGTTTTPTAPGRSPSWSTSSRAGDARRRPTAARSTRSRRAEQRELVDSYRLAYIAEAPVNWCPGLGTVLANEEVTADGRSERGNFPVYKRPLKQWMMRITAYADRLLADLDLLDWSESIKLMQRNWIGRSTGALARFPVEGHDGVDDRGVHDPARHAVRRDLHGARARAPARRRDHRERVARRRDRERLVERGARRVEGHLRRDGHAGRRGRALPRVRGARSRSSSARPRAARRPACSPARSRSTPRTATIPIFIADYVLMGYGTGAIMAVPAHDQRDFEFAREFELPIVAGDPAERRLAGGARRVGRRHEHVARGVRRRRRRDELRQRRGLARRAARRRREARDRRVARARRARASRPSPTSCATGCSAASATGASRSRSSTTTIGPIALPESMLPVELPEITDFEPATSDDPDALPAAAAGARRRLGRGRARPSRRPAWAGYGGGRRARTCARRTRCRSGRDRAGTTCATSIPTNEDALVDPAVEREWAQGVRGDGSPKAGLVDLYVGGVEHAVLHLLYARFWHKVLFDLGHVSTLEPFQRLVNQGMIQAAAYTDERGIYVEAVGGRRARRRVPLRRRRR